MSMGTSTVTPSRSRRLSTQSSLLCRPTGEPAGSPSVSGSATPRVRAVNRDEVGKSSLACASFWAASARGTPFPCTRRARAERRLRVRSCRSRRRRASSRRARRRRGKKATIQTGRPIVSRVEIGKATISPLEQRFDIGAAGIAEVGGQSGHDRWFSQRAFPRGLNWQRPGFPSCSARSSRRAATSRSTS